MSLTEHLVGRCGTCRHWSTYTMGIGYCQLDTNIKDSPLRCFDGGIETRIDFGCLWHNAEDEA